MFNAHLHTFLYERYDICAGSFLALAFIASRFRPLFIKIRFSIFRPFCLVWVSASLITSPRFASILLSFRYLLNSPAKLSLLYHAAWPACTASYICYRHFSHKCREINFSAAITHTPLRFAWQTTIIVSTCRFSIHYNMLAACRCRYTPPVSVLLSPHRARHFPNAPPISNLPLLHFILYFIHFVVISLLFICIVEKTFH